MKSGLLAGFLVFALANFCHSQTAQLSEYTANYEASANGLAATATRTLSRSNQDSYRLTNSLSATLVGQTLASLHQSSEFLIEDNRVIPQSYSYQLSGVSRASNAIGYNWEAGIAVSSEDEESWQLPLRTGVMDQLSYQAALRLMLADTTGENSSFTFEIIDGEKMDIHEYRVLGREQLATPLGELNTLKLERVREAADDRVTEIWLAPDWEFLLARLEQVNGSGLHIVLELKSAILDGEEIRAED